MPGVTQPGRGAGQQPPNRFERLHVEESAPNADDWIDDDAPALRTEYFVDSCLLYTSPSPRD